MSDTPFQRAAVKAFRETIVETVSDGCSPPYLEEVLHETVRRFEGKIAAQADAFKACTSADELEVKLARIRAGNALEEFVRAWNARKDLAYARERFWAVFEPPTQPRLF